MGKAAAPRTDAPVDAMHTGADLARTRGAAGAAPTDASVAPTDAVATRTRADKRVASLDWAALGAALDEEGFALLPAWLDDEDVHDLLASRDAWPVAPSWLRVSDDTDRGERRLLPTPLPVALRDWPSALYRPLARIADRWNAMLDDPYRYPPELEHLLDENHGLGQFRPQSTLCRLREGDCELLHQRSNGSRIFPLQLVALLDQPGRDFTGGQLVLTEQRPRMQSRPIVVPLQRGDAALIAVAQRPRKGTRGSYRVNLKHAIARVRSGERNGIELLFHHAPSR